MSHLKTPSVIPFPHQREGILAIEKCQGRTLLADDMGLGKTIQCLGVLRRNPDWLPAIIVCPANVKWNWEVEANLHFGMRASVCEGETPPDSVGVISHQSPLMIINYDILSSWVDHLKKIRCQTIIFDECQYLSDRSSKRTKACVALAKSIPRRIAVSGTPIQNRPVELFPVANLVWPEAFPSWMAFVEKYCECRLLPWGWDYSGAKNLPDLHATLVKLGMIRRRKDILNLPKKTRRVKIMPLENAREYQFASTNFLDWIKQAHAHRYRKVKKVAKLARIGYLLRLSAQLKRRFCVERINKYLRDRPGEKVVVMAHHVDFIQHLKDEIEAKSVVIDGSVCGKLRQDAVDQFQKDPETRVCIGNLKAAGVGITLTAARMMFVLEFWFNPATHAQVEDRIHRIGQKHDCLIEYLVGEGTIEVDICKLLEKRTKLSQAAIDGESYIDDKLSLYEELLKVIEGERMK